MKRLALFLFTVVLAVRAVGQTPQSSSPDVFLITIDTLRADHVGCYGYKQVETPALDALAGDGFRFTEAFTHSPITNTSHATILTGLLPSVHGVTDFGVPLLPQHVTAAELLKAHGYQTAAFIGAVILDSSSLAPGFDRGFDFYDNFPKTDGNDKNLDGTNKERWDRVERRGMEVVDMPRLGSTSTVTVLTLCGCICLTRTIPMSLLRRFWRNIKTTCMTGKSPMPIRRWRIGLRF